MSSHKNFRTESMDDVGRHTFIPGFYAFESQKELLAFVADRPLGQLLTSVGGVIDVSTLPIIRAAHEPRMVFYGHLAKRNQHAEKLVDGLPCVMTFTGPSAYISPRWFKEKKTVPTWNYMSVQMRGNIELIHDASDIHTLLSMTIDHMERELVLDDETPEPWKIDEASPELLARLSGMIVGFKLHISHVEGVQRLCQDKPAVDVESIAQGLARSARSNSQEMAELVRSKARGSVF